MKKSELFYVLENAIAVIPPPVAKEDAIRHLVELRNKLAPKRSRVMVIAQGKNGDVVEGPMSLEKAKEKLKFLAALGHEAVIRPAPPQERKTPARPRKPKKRGGGSEA